MVVTRSMPKARLLKASRGESRLARRGNAADNNAQAQGLELWRRWLSLLGKFQGRQS
jgi:hypothetical protein